MTQGQQFSEHGSHTASVRVSSRSEFAELKTMVLNAAMTIFITHDSSPPHGKSWPAEEMGALQACSPVYFRRKCRCHKI